ncbi:lysoplasmalogenase [Polymixia lowei]
MDILETDAYDRRRRRNTSCALLLSLAPFLSATAVYFYLWSPESGPSVLAAGVKAAPTLSLAVLVFSWNGGQSVLGVAGGLLFSAVGDCCLVWPELFLPGMGAFAVAHLQYSFTFLTTRYATYSSSSSWSGLFYLLLFVTGGGFYIYLYPFLQRTPDSRLLTPAVGVYTVLITVMAALAVRTRRAATLLGSLSFLVSDMMVALTVFKATGPLEHGNTIVMGTYYLAQLLIAVGDVKMVENKDDFSKWKKT